MENLQETEKQLTAIINTLQRFGFPTGIKPLIAYISALQAELVEIKKEIDTNPAKALQRMQRLKLSLPDADEIIAPESESGKTGET